jgi:hypothetical protein
MVLVWVLVARMLGVEGGGDGDAMTGDGGGDGDALACGDAPTGGDGDALACGDNSFDGLVNNGVSLDVIIICCFIAHFFWAHLIATKHCTFFWIRDYID